MTCASGGPPVVIGRVGLYSGLCSVSNLARLHADDVPRLNNNSKASSARATHAAASLTSPARKLGAGGLAADWNAAQLRAVATLNEHANFNHKQDDCGVVDADELQEAPEWWEQEAQEDVEAEARGGGEGSLWGQALHLQTQVRRWRCCT